MHVCMLCVICMYVCVYECYGMDVSMYVFMYDSYVFYVSYARLCVCV